MNDIHVVYDIVLVDVPALHEIDVLEEHGIFEDTINNQLVEAQRVRDIDASIQCRER